MLGQFLPSILNRWAWLLIKTRPQRLKCLFGRIGTFILLMIRLMYLIIFMIFFLFPFRIHLKIFSFLSTCINCFIFVAYEYLFRSLSLTSSSLSNSLRRTPFILWKITFERIAHLSQSQSLEKYLSHSRSVFKFLILPIISISLFHNPYLYEWIPLKM